MCWETVMGHPYPFPDPPPVDAMVRFRLAPYPWRQRRPGVKVKTVATFGDIGPSFSFVKLETGAELASRRLKNYTFAAVIAGRISAAALDLDEMNVMLGAPGDEIGSLRADKPTLLWLIDWKGE